MVTGCFHRIPSYSKSTIQDSPHYSHRFHLCRGLNSLKPSMDLQFPMSLVQVLQNVPRCSTMTSITITLMSRNFFCPLTRSKYLLIFSLNACCSLFSLKSEWQQFSPEHYYYYYYYYYCCCCCCFWVLAAILASSLHWRTSDSKPLHLSKPQNFRWF